MMGYSTNRPFVKVDVTGEVDKRFGEVTSQLAENANLSRRTAFNNGVTATDTRLKNNKRKMLSHLNGSVIATSTDVVVTNTEPNKMIIQTPGAGGYTVRFNATREAGESLLNYVDLVISALDWSKITSITLKLVLDKTDTNSYYSILMSGINAPLIKDSIPSKQKSLFRFPKTAFVKTGTPAYFGLNSNSEISLLVGTLEPTTITLHDGVLASEPNAPTMIMFDDGLKEVYDYAFPLMQARGIVGTFFVITNSVGADTHCTWEQLQEMQEAGWTIANHSSDHSNLMNVTLDEAITAVEEGAGELTKRGFRGANILAAPFNALDSTRNDYVTHVAKSLRLGADGLLNYNNPLLVVTYPAIVRARSVENTDTPNYVFTNDYQAKKAVGYLQAINYHRIDPVGAGQYDYSADNFEATLDLLIGDNATFINYEEYLNAYLENWEN